MARENSPTTKQVGDRGERLAVGFLEGEGYRIIETNFRMKLGELDIVAEEDGVICFVEVRSRASLVYGDPLETINWGKQRKLIRTANYYLSFRGLWRRMIRFDAIGIVYQPRLKIELVRGAFLTS